VASATSRPGTAVIEMTTASGRPAGAVAVAWLPGAEASQSYW